ncbi:DUF3040 domain-containing protein [Streptomyces achromogenes]|uniref:DUF3040 domain-containing protein n=1 Tax=Streptomyces achromogenes TaxID=67255 RepID=UPI001FD86CAB|nr:DUF3040 domain-containing protein [Streptomyces achromogenes]
MVAGSAAEEAGSATEEIVRRSYASPGLRHRIGRRVRGTRWHGAPQAADRGGAVAVDEWKMWEHDGVRLSARERLALARIEAGLRQDRRFARRMGDARYGLWLPVAVLLLAVASVFVAVMGIRTSDPALLWCFALLWPFTLIQAFRLLCRATRPRLRRPHRRPRPTPWL